ncbi:class I SAM-dependent methyltransferase [Flagellimonas algicola]|uniref:Class I SAM-dependent methyltransferase n=1 Tax=Flagellimonas algicola TaxID=2583815 RepID=A0ABY2WR54_9FLAO|nr:class I SAM-dependent methyltransferase [Allomuricauda algicola]TMU57132.1 class I SAM-dependent methyltransferase [Allomuricauda algicola]
MMNNYYQTQESVQEYIRLAKDVNGRSLIEKLSNVLPLNSKILEIGSGPGLDWRILNESYQITGSDNSDQFLKHLKAENPTGEFLDLDAKTLKTNQKFDGIYSNKVLHHLKDDALSESINRQHAILNSKGIICHSFWKGEGSEIFKGLFVNYHTKVALEQLFRPHFEILLLETYKEFEEGDSFLLIGKKK